jgi:NADH:ubiquinone oxidoreductase subunit F (NADH-binding)
MKKVFLPLLAVAFVLSASSCAKCVTCKKGDQWTKVCDKGNSSTDQDNTIKTYETLGWDCKKSSQIF